MKEKLNTGLRTVTLRQLRALTAVLQEGSLSRAAELTSVTPPAVSLQLRQLEELVGLPLLERLPNGYRATDAGTELLAAAHQIDRALSECDQAIHSLHDAEAGHVAVGVISTAKYFAPYAIAAFRRRNPRIEIGLMVGNREDMLAQLESHKLDFAITGRPVAGFEVDKEVVGDHPHVIIAPPESPLVGRKLDLAELASETFLLRERGSGTRRVLHSLFEDAGLGPPAGMEIGSNETIKQAVIAGLGIALLSAHTILYEVQERRLAVLNVEGLPAMRQWFVVKRKEKRLLPAAQKLWTFFATNGREYLPGATPL